MPVDWMSSNHVGTSTEMNGTIVQQQRNRVFYMIHAEMGMVWSSELSIQF
jgi:hypothetical protein